MTILVQMAELVNIRTAAICRRGTKVVTPTEALPSVSENHYYDPGKRQMYLPWLRYDGMIYGGEEVKIHVSQPRQEM
jgi:hypothetical protein